MGKCPKCGKDMARNPGAWECQQTSHHIFPTGQFRKESPTIEICECCHRKLNKLIVEMEKQILGAFANEYFWVLQKFLSEEEKDVYSL